MPTWELLWLVVAAVAWWIGATGAAARSEIRSLEMETQDSEDYAFLALLRRLRDDPVALSLRCRVARAAAAVFLPLGLAGATARWPGGWVALAVGLGWLAASTAEASGGGSFVRRVSRARGGLGYGLWARTLHPAARLLRPLARLRRRPPMDGGAPAHLLAETRASRTVGGAELGREERRFLRRLLASTGILVADIATRWDQVRRIPAGAGIEEAFRAFRESGHSRLPVMGERGVVGLVTVKDVLARESPAEGLPLRPVYFVRQDVTARHLLEELQEARVHLAVVVDRLGRETGIATMEDVLEEIVGELHDEREAPAR